MGIKKTSTEDLLTLRKSIILYLKSKKLKKRNGNFMDVYQRISAELKERKSGVVEDKTNLKGYTKVEIEMDDENLRDQLSISAFNEGSTQSFLRRKTSSIDIHIPSFLNDKKQKKEEVQKTDTNEVDKKPSLAQNFGKGLFDEKLDFDPSSDMDNFKVSKKAKFDTEIKEIEIKNAMFNPLEEDIFFSLD